jgi:hypothetical protein
MKLTAIVMLSKETGTRPEGGFFRGFFGFFSLDPPG